MITIVNAVTYLPVDDLAFCTAPLIKCLFCQGDLVYKDGNCKVYQVIGRKCEHEGKTYYTKSYTIKDAKGEKFPDITPQLLSPADPDWPRYKVQDGTVLSPEAVSIVLNWGENCPHKTQD